MGSVEITSGANNTVIYWLPMAEQNRESSSTQYCKTYMTDWETHIGNKGVVVIHCNEGLYRSVALNDSVIKNLKTHN